MMVVVTHNVSGRIRGFLASSMLEIAPGVYTGARISTAVRSRIRDVLDAWFAAEKEASIVMVWRDPEMPGGQNVEVFGAPPVNLVEMDGIVLTHRKRPESRKAGDSQS